MELTETLKHIEQIPSSSVGATSVPTANYNASEFTGITNDPAVMEFWSTHRILPKIGEVRSTKKGTQQMWVNNRLVFEAKLIKDRRSISKDGTIALAAVSREVASAVASEGGKPSEMPSSIWLIDNQGNKKQVTPPIIDASFPLITPEGNAIAFTGSRIGTFEDSGGTLQFVVDLKTGRYRAFGPCERLDNYSVGAVEWSEDRKVLKVLEDHGETGGHMVMKQIRLD